MNGVINKASVIKTKGIEKMIALSVDFLDNKAAVNKILCLVTSSPWIAGIGSEGYFMESRH